MSILLNEAVIASQIPMTKEVVLRTINNLQRFADQGNESAKLKIEQLREKYADLLKD